MAPNHARSRVTLGPITLGPITLGPNRLGPITLGRTAPGRIRSHRGRGAGPVAVAGLIVLAGSGAVFLAGCGSDGATVPTAQVVTHAGAPAAQPEGSGPVPDSPVPDSPVPGSPVPGSPVPGVPAASTPSGLGASDGTRLAACEDGDCEVEVREGDRLKIDRRFGLDALTVLSVGHDTLTLELTGTSSGLHVQGPRVSVQRACTNGRCRERGEMTLFAGVPGRINDLAVGLERTGPSTAVLSIHHT
ncbi:hypothetical protein JOL79_04285 [Microbispora sp. RL4-1S]|uniref:Uncharacterized protein n=1 Tax=Microbispora oryzae TaxID=2806554 RepID=A0A940WK70_9ACTN|nr:hypothetical protein [Microbispora oryzae]MBP2703020.1 hypothetical protein [Microbispora oryzae]